MSAAREEVVRAAAQLERDGRAFYLEVAGKTANPLAKRMFESLADDERSHLAWIEQMEPGVDTAETANRDLFGRLGHIFADVPEARLRSVAGSDDDVQAINVALGMEKQSVDAYEKWANESAEDDVRKLCTTLVGIEKFHIQVLNNTLEYFERTGDWFMQEEQWNFEGA